LGPGASLRTCYEEAGGEVERRFKHVDECATVSSVGARGRFYDEYFTRLKIVDPSTS
jgi:hypothetical protein